MHDITRSIGSALLIWMCAPRGTASADTDPANLYFHKTVTDYPSTKSRGDYELINMKPRLYVIDGTIGAGDIAAGPITCVTEASADLSMKRLVVILTHQATPIRWVTRKG
jgi:hypothetical protein